jgi:RNA polymerase sigma-70 factor (ECF subfamily)
MTPSQQPLEFVALWSAHSRQMYSYIYSLVPNCTDADDVFQETSVTLMQKFDEFDPASSFSAWACRVAYFKVLSLLKKRRPFEHLDDEFLEAIETTVRQSSFEAEPRFDALSHCLEQLSPKDRKLIEARYHQDMAVEVVAQKLSRNPSGVYKSLTRIHDALLECIRRRLAKGESS